MGKDRVPCDDDGTSKSESWGESDIESEEGDQDHADVTAFISAFSECKRFSEARSNIICRFAYRSNK